MIAGVYFDLRRKRLQLSLVKINVLKLDRALVTDRSHQLRLGILVQYRGTAIGVSV